MRNDISDLVIRAKEENEIGLKAKKELYKELSLKIYNLTLRITENEFDAEDATVKTFENAFRNIAKLKNPDFFTTWIYRIAINVSKNILKSSGRKEIDLNDTMEVRETNNSNQSSSDESKDIITKAMKNLEEIDRQIIILYEFQEKSYQEIAEILDIRIGTVRSRLSRAREALRKEVKKY